MPNVKPALSLLAMVLALGAPAAAARAEPAWPTYHHDAERSGLDPELGSAIAPSLAWQSPNLGAPIWSQPLILGSRVYVATVGGDLDALDASTGAVIWKKHAGTPVPSGSLPCGDITPTVGIVGTPVIDPALGEIFAVADTWDGSHAHHELVAYDLATGAEKLRTPVDPPGAEPKTLLQRAALNLDRGHVIFGFGGNDGDCGTYLGTVVSAPEAGGTPAFWQVPIATKTKSGGAVWGASGPAINGEGDIFASTGNPNPGGGEHATVYDYSDSLVELSPELSLSGHFKPPSWEADSNSDQDLGSAGPELLPGGVIFQAGKNGTGYLIGQSGMGSGAEALYSHQVCAGAASFGGDAYAGGTIYVACSNGVQALAYNQAKPSFSVLWKGPGDAAGPPIVSGGLVWVVSTHSSPAGAKLYGLDPASGAVRYTETLPSPAIDHFASPSAAGGGVYLATGSSVTAYRIGTAPSAPLPAPPSAPAVEPRGPAAALVGSGALAVSASGLALKLRCASWAHVCKGTILLRTLKAVRAHDRLAILTLATGRFTIAAGRLSTVRLRLGPRARHLLSQHKRLRARLTVSVLTNSGREVLRTTVVLTVAPRHRRR